MFCCIASFHPSPQNSNVVVDCRWVGSGDGDITKVHKKTPIKWHLIFEFLMEKIRMLQKLDRSTLIKMVVFQSFDLWLNFNKRLTAI